MNRRLCWTRTALVAALGLALSAPVAFAQGQSAPPPQGAAPAGQADTGPAPSDAELQHFAKAVLQVQTIKNSLQPELANAKSANDRTQIEQSAEKKMEAAVRSNDLSPKRYVEIANVVQTDPAVRKKVQDMMPPQPQPQAPQAPQPQS